MLSHSLPRWRNNFELNPFHMTYQCNFLFKYRILRTLYIWFYNIKQKPLSVMTAFDSYYYYNLYNSKNYFLCNVKHMH